MRKKQSKKIKQKKSQKTKRKDTIYLVPHTHYDAVWVFTKEDYFYINIDLILKKAVELIEKTDYKFLIEQTFLLEKIEKRNPKLFSKIKKFVQQGKIEIADGEYLMADTMLANGETLVREILFGKKYLKEKFGIDVPVMWGADSFGYNAQLPQIYKKSGYKYFAFRRGADKKKFSEFLWKGLDGTKILSHWMPKGYRAGLDLQKLRKTYKELKELAASSHILMPSGSGVTPPQPETSNEVKKWNKKYKDAEIKISRSIDFFKAMEKEARKLEIRKGELYSGKFSEVFPDCASTRMWIKQGTRKYENSILACERWAVVSYILSNLHGKKSIENSEENNYPSDELRESWRDILFLGFHDVLPGTGIDSCYPEVKEIFHQLKNEISEISEESFANIAKSLKVKTDIIVFNPLGFEIKNWTEVELNFERGKIKAIKGLKSNKEEIEVEILQSIRHEDYSLRKVKIGFIAMVPALGYQTYKILTRKPRLKKSSVYLKNNGNIIKNSFFKFKVNPENGLIDIYQKGKWIAGGNSLVLEEELGDLYYHRQILDEPFKTEGGDGIKYGAFKVKKFEIKESPIRTVIKIKGGYLSLRWPYRLLHKMKPLLWRHKFFSFAKEIIIYKDIPRIDFTTLIDNQHPHIRARVRFFTDVKSKKYNCESQFGVVERPTDQHYAKQNEEWKEQPSGTFPSLNWIDYSDKNKGLTVINAGIPENEIRDGNIYLTLFRSVQMVSGDGKMGPTVPVPDAAEFGKHCFYYSLFPHQKDWKQASSFAKAYESSFRPKALQLPIENNGYLDSNKKSLPSEMSFLEIKPNNIILTALKKAEQDDDIILRFFETKGEKTKTEITLFRKPKTVKIVNLLEQEEKEIDFQDQKIKMEVKPFEIVSLKIGF